MGAFRLRGGSSNSSCDESPESENMLFAASDAARFKTLAMLLAAKTMLKHEKCGGLRLERTVLCAIDSISNRDYACEALGPPGRAT